MEQKQSGQLDQKLLIQTLQEDEANSDFPQLNFEQFLANMRSNEAFALTRYFKSFLREYTRRKWSCAESQKIIRDFLMFMSNQQNGKFLECALYRTASAAQQAEFAEGLEKLTCIKLYSLLIDQELQQDLLVDKLLNYKIELHSPWISLQNFDINFKQDSVLHVQGVDPNTANDTAKTLNHEVENAIIMAATELCKMDEYKAPRDKLISIVNCCKILLGFLEKVQADHSLSSRKLNVLSPTSSESSSSKGSYVPPSPQSPQMQNAPSADDLMPFLIYSILKSFSVKRVNYRLYANIMYVQRYRNEDKLKSEAGYYLTCIHAAIGFIVNMSYESLTWPAGGDGNESTAVNWRSYYDEKVAHCLQKLDDANVPTDTELELAKKIVRGEEVLISKTEPLKIQEQPAVKKSMSKASFTSSSLGDAVQKNPAASSSASFLTPAGGAGSDRPSISKQLSGVMSRIFDTGQQASSSQTSSANQSPPARRSTDVSRGSPEDQQTNVTKFKNVAQSIAKDLYDAAVMPFSMSDDEDVPKLPPRSQYPANMAVQGVQQQSGSQSDNPEHMDFEMQMALAISLSMAEAEKLKGQDVAADVEDEGRIMLAETNRAGAVERGDDDEGDDKEVENLIDI